MGSTAHTLTLARAHIYDFEWRQSNDIHIHERWMWAHTTGRSVPSSLFSVYEKKLINIKCASIVSMYKYVYVIDFHIQHDRFRVEKS